MSPYIIPGLNSKIMESLRLLSTETSFKRIIEVILHETGKTEADIIKKDRTRELVELRMMSMWAIRKNTSATWKQIGNYFHRDHTTAIASYHTIEDLIKIKDRNIMNIVSKIGSILMNAILTLLLISFISCLGQYPDLQINERGKIINANQDSSKIYYHRYVYYKSKLDAMLKKQNDNPYTAYDKKIFMYEDSCRKYKELIERKK